MATRDALLQDVVEVRGMNWIEIAPPAPGFEAEVEGRVRHAGQLQAGRLVVTAPDAAHMHFAEKVFAPTPGQALVAYRGDAVLAGGTITKAPQPGAGAPSGC